MNEIRFALRALARVPGYTVTALAMFALGIGLTVYMFGAVNGYLLGSLPFPDAQRLVHVSVTDAPGTREYDDLTLRMLDAFRQSQTTMSALGAISVGTVNLSGDERPERYSGGLVNGALFEALGVAPRMGRTLQADDDLPGAPLVIVLSDEVWRHRFDADPDIVGRRVRVNGQDAEVVGVMPSGFAFPQKESVWIPRQEDIAALGLADGFEVAAMGRLRPGVTPTQAQAELQGLYDALRATAPDVELAPTVELRSLREWYMSSEARTIILTLFASVVLVLLIACSNVANLTLARVAARRRELAVRASLGASRTRLILGVALEVLLVALVGAVVGMLLADTIGAWTNAQLTSSQEAPPYWVDFGWNWRDYAFTVGAAALAALVSGLIPAWRATRGDLNAGLRDGGHGTAGGGPGRPSRALVVVQITLCCILLVNAGLMLRSAMNLNAVDDGLGGHNQITGRIGLSETTHPDAAAQLGAYQRLEQELAALPGVRSVALSSSLPLAGGAMIRVARDGAEYASDSDMPRSRWVTVTPGFFDTFGVPLVQGRAFTTADDADGARVAIVNQRFAEREWPGESAIGQRVQVSYPDGGAVTVVGVVADFAQHGNDLVAGTFPALYVPLAQETVRFVSFAAAVDGDPASYANLVRDAMLRVDADTPIYWLRTFDEVTSLTLFMNRFLASLFGAFAATALLLAAVGVYAVLATHVVARTREIGVRRALGAQDHAIVRMIVGQGGRQYALGMVVGLAGALLFSQAMTGMHVGVTPFDPVTLGVVAVVLGLAALAASWAPAKRALRIQPMEALRDE